MATPKQERPTRAPAAKQSRARRAVVADPPAAGLAERALGSEAAERAAGTVQGRAAIAGAARTTTAAPHRAAPKRVGHARAEPDLRGELRGFAAAHPGGWSHEEWTELMERLTLSGYDTLDRDAIGLMLERARLGLLLAKVQGLGEKRRDAVLERFAMLWQLREAGAAELVALPGITRPLAARILEALP